MKLETKMQLGYILEVSLFVLSGNLLNSNLFVALIVFCAGLWLSMLVGDWIVAFAKRRKKK
jgi:hypothetical protein